jgi:hypothetical protein
MIFKAGGARQLSHTDQNHPALRSVEVHA